MTTFDRKQYAKTITEEVAKTLPGYQDPDDRHCKNCGKLMKPQYEQESMPKDTPPGPGIVWQYIQPVRIIRIRYYGYQREGFFCTASCGYDFGCAAVLAGYTRKE